MLWCTLRGWDRDAQRAVFSSFNIATQIVISLIPTLLGARLYSRFSADAFRRLARCC